MNNPWFVRTTPRPEASRQLFCLPYAGAGPSAFRTWGAVFGAGVEIVAVHLPGRESRFTEVTRADQREIAAAIADFADRPYALFGHSFGGRLGFEVVRELRALGAALPLRLFPSASRPPHVKITNGLLDGLSTASDDELVAALADGGGMPDAVLAEPELLELVLPAVRLDLGWLDDYSHREQPPLPVPITAFAGEDDRLLPPSLISEWARHTSAGFTMHTQPGGHFFVNEQLPAVAALVRAELDAAPALVHGGGAA